MIFSQGGRLLLPLHTFDSGGTGRAVNKSQLSETTAVSDHDHQITVNKDL